MERLHAKKVSSRATTKQNTQIIIIPLTSGSLSFLTAPSAMRGPLQRNAHNALALTSGQPSATRHVTLYPRSLAACDSGGVEFLLKTDTASQSAHSLSKYVTTFGPECDTAKAASETAPAGAGLKVHVVFISQILHRIVKMTFLTQGCFA